MEQKRQHDVTSAVAGKDYSLKLPQIVEDTLTKVLPSDDVLDRPEFDAHEFINRNFSDEQSLADINNFVDQLRGRMGELDDSLSQASQEQSLAAHQALLDLKEAKMATHQLFNKIHDIRGKAEQSETMVHEICRDIKQLDYAKRHLQTTLTALKRLHMLVNAVDQLELMSSQRNYRVSASLLEAVNQLFTHFDGYTNVPKIVELHRTARTVQEELEGQIFADFQSVAPMELLDNNFPSEEERRAVVANLSAACTVVDALGKATREKLIHLFCDDQLISYEKKYGEGGECSGLQQAEARYTWFYNLLGSINIRLDAVFPKHWQIARRLCIEFCQRTRKHLLVQTGALTPDEMDVTLLLKSLQRTILFERDAAQRFEDVSKGQEEVGEMELDENGDVINPVSAEGIERKHRRQKLEAERNSQKVVIEENDEVSIEKYQSLPTILGMISRSFDPFMSAYVALERRNMEQMINQVMIADIVDRNGHLPVFSSSVNMFAYIRNSIKRCTALTNTQTFFDLQTEFKHCFRLYSQRLLEKLPTASSSTAPVGSLDSVSSSANSKVKLADKQEEELCFVINTAEYCAETLPSLEEVIRAKIDKAFSEAVELSQEIEAFHDVGAAAMKCILAGLETLLDDELIALHKTNWQAWETVGDESLYVAHMGEKLRAFVPVLRQMLSPLYFTNFCDKFATSFVPKLLQSILKCRKVNQVATQQLLLDVYALKTLFLQLPVLSNDASPSSPTIPSRYTKFVTNEIANVENLLKLIGTPNEMLVESFKIIWPDGTAEDFQRIMNVKGLKKSEQTGYLETLGVQRKHTGKIAEMEGKMSDMTENWRKNVQNFAKVPFAFTTGMNANTHNQS
ncbi:hypothetical protein PsorP6_008554 [Peronosclerospora sorghi]|uniref:Uncharacterized protein n=1 Tax=Peronosclerospora sorghi TaxID=230839 RepID=A0ACC0W8X8_9STRA|nr:hypothetical protein PsorP6_008554 [Peronosclerospora sorghi]